MRDGAQLHVQVVHSASSLLSLILVYSAEDHKLLSLAHLM